MPDTFFGWVGPFEQTFTVPAGVHRLDVEAWAGAGYAMNRWGYAAGLTVTGMAVTPGETLTIRIGGHPLLASGGDPVIDPTGMGGVWMQVVTVGGWNGGGTGGGGTSLYVNGTDPPQVICGTGGGGATEILRGGVPVLVVGGTGGYVLALGALDLDPLLAPAAVPAVGDDPRRSDPAFPAILAGNPDVSALAYTPGAPGGPHDGAAGIVVGAFGSGGGGGGYGGGASGGYAEYDLADPPGPPAHHTDPLNGRNGGGLVPPLVTGGSWGQEFAPPGVDGNGGIRVVWDGPALTSRWHMGHIGIGGAL